MKRFLAVLTFLVLLSSLSSAEITAKGVKVGVNSTNLHGAYTDMDPKISFCFGGFIVYKVANDFFIQPEIYLTRRGARAKEEDAKLTIKYLEVPVLAKLVLNAKSESDFKYFVFAGGYYSFYLGGKEVVEREEYALDVEKSDYGLVIGAGTDLIFFERKFTVDVRYSFGTKIIDPDEEDIKNKALTLTIGYIF